jgi:hypothetical protein
MTEKPRADDQMIPKEKDPPSRQLVALDDSLLRFGIHRRVQQRAIPLRIAYAPWTRRGAHDTVPLSDQELRRVQVAM